MHTNIFDITVINTSNRFWEIVEESYELMREKIVSVNKRKKKHTTGKKKAALLLTYYYYQCLVCHESMNATRLLGFSCSQIFGEKQQESSLHQPCQIRFPNA